MREKPRQSRSEKTVDFISEATVQVLDQGNTETFTTNHIAERAGVSIGTLYRYFPDKGALLRFVVRREIKRTSAHVFEVIENSRANSADTLVTEVVDASLTAFGRRASATQAIRSLAQNDNQLLSEMGDLRMRLMRSLHKRLHVLDPERFGPISTERLAAAGEAYRSAILKLSSSTRDEEMGARTRADLAIGLLSSLSS